MNLKPYVGIYLALPSFIFNEFSGFRASFLLGPNREWGHQGEKNGTRGARIKSRVVEALLFFWGFWGRSDYASPVKRADSPFVFAEHSPTVCFALTNSLVLKFLQLSVTGSQNLRRGPQWSPFKFLFPAQRRTFSFPGTGNAGMEWMRGSYTFAKRKKACT